MDSGGRDLGRLDRNSGHRGAGRGAGHPGVEMTSPVEQERTALENLIVVLAYAQGTQAVQDALLAMPGVSAEAVRTLFLIPQAHALAWLHPRPGAHAAVLATHRTNVMRRASYYVAAARRLSTAHRMGPDAVARAVTVERNYLQQHLRAVSQREEVARQVAAQARIAQREAKQADSVWNGLLGWYAVGDMHTSPECLRANRRNFDPKQVPPIGFPGAVHPNCRCKPGPPFNTNRRVERIRPERTTAQREAEPKRVTIGI